MPCRGTKIHHLGGQEIDMYYYCIPIYPKVDTFPLMGQALPWSKERESRLGWRYLDNQNMRFDALVIKIGSIAFG